jgi:uncharacterized protein
MKLEQRPLTLRNAEPALGAKGVRHAAVFGSTARGKAGAKSDIDILVDSDPSASVTVYDYVALKNDIASLFEAKVDGVDREGLKPHLRQRWARTLSMPSDRRRIPSLSVIPPESPERVPLTLPALPPVPLSCARASPAPGRRRTQRRALCPRSSAAVSH